MSCGSCVARVERALKSSTLVDHVTVNYATERAAVSLAGRELPPLERDGALKALAEAVVEAGYEVAHASWSDLNQAQQTTPSHTPSPAPEARPSARLNTLALGWRRRFVFGIVAMPAVLLLQMGQAWFELPVGMGRLMTAGAGAVTLLILIFTGRPFFVGALAGLRRRRANMDTLVALGAGVAFCASAVILIEQALDAQMLVGAPVYFDGAAMIVTLISLGKWLEARARGAASASMESLLDLTPLTARVERGGAWQEGVPVEQLKPGDRIAVKPGEAIPADGRVTFGSVYVDESMLTGESTPVTRSAGMEVVAATTNLDGYLEIEVTRTGSHTTLARIVTEVERAQQTRASVQRFADRISAVFVPAILLLALFTAAIWAASSGDITRAAMTAVAVLVVACPCALGLATPTALMVGAARGARRGILIRDADALEIASEIDDIIFDKTGTLTTGELSVRRLIPLSDALDERDLLARLAALERGSEHPIGRAIIKRAAQAEPGDQRFELEDFKALAGFGVEATLDGRRCALGKPSWIKEILPGQTERLDELAREHLGTLVVLAELDGELLGAALLEDTLRPEAAEAVAALIARGHDVWLVSGDSAPVVEALAQQVGISAEHVVAGVLPHEKADMIRDLQRHERKVAMIGDGINDAPALAQADLGIAMGTGADVAIEAAHITLVGRDLNNVVVATALAQATYATIRQNLFWAFAYNVALIPLAATGWMRPGWAAGAMALSSVTVVANALRLRHKSL